MREIEHIFARLAQSAFRCRFHLGKKDRAYLEEKGLDTILAHARDFVAQRLAPAAPRNDGKQTPFRGHPVFVAQHATATCCRGCLETWHGIPKGRALTETEETHIAAVIRHWLEAERLRPPPAR